MLDYTNCIATSSCYLLVVAEWEVRQLIVQWWSQIWASVHICIYQWMQLLWPACKLCVGPHTHTMDTMHTMC